MTINPRRVLVTGSSGAVGKVLVPELLLRGHFVRGLDLKPSVGVQEMLVGSIADADLVARATENIDVLVHLAAEPNDCDFLTRLVPSNVVGLYNVLSSAAKSQIKRYVLASSVQTIDALPRPVGRRLLVSDGVSPRNHYGLTKVWLEEMCRMYARMNQASAVCVRLGWMPRTVDEASRIRGSKNAATVYISPADTGRLFRACVESDNPAVGETLVVYGTSKSAPDAGFDYQTAVDQLGYDPRHTFPEGMPTA